MERRPVADLREASVLETLWLGPRNSMRVAFIETWARVRGLSLVEKLTVWTNLATNNVWRAPSKPRCAAKWQCVCAKAHSKSS